MESLPRRPLDPLPPRPDRTAHDSELSSASSSSPDFPFFLPLPSPSSAPPSAAATTFQQPALLTTYSMHAPLIASSSTNLQPRHQSFDNSSLSIHRPCPLNANLREGFPNNVTYRSHDLNEGIDSLLESLRAEERKKKGRAWEKGKEPVVCFRGVLTKLVTAPYEKRDGISLNVMEVDGVVYMEQHKEVEEVRNYNGGESAAEFTYYGYAFESYSTVPSIPTPLPAREVPAGWASDVDTNEEWCAVIKTAIAGTRVVIGGEVDCVKGSFEGTLRNALELKTNVTINSARAEQTFESKLLKHWAQSFLLGIPEIEIGFRRHSPPTIQTLQTFQTRDIPRMVRGKPNTWDPMVCLSFGGEALRFIKSTVLSGKFNRPEQEMEQPRIWRVVLEAEKGLEIRLLSEEEGRVVEQGRAKVAEGRWGFLPGWVKGWRSEKLDL